MSMRIHLSPRLETVAREVPQGAAVIDVGTDHAMLPVWLVQTGRVQRAIASDLRPGPLQGAADLIRRTGTEENITLRLTDGLTGLGPKDGDTVILAGMGGETMVSILSAAPWTRGGTLLILEPQSKQAVLRRFLTENGYQILSERLVKDSGRIYPVLCAQGGPSQEYSPAELVLGAFGQIAGDPLFAEYLALARRAALQAAPYDLAAAERVREYDGLKERLEETWRQ